MRKLALSLIIAFACYLTAAAAQAGGGMAPGSRGAQGSPTMQQPGSTQPGATQPGQPPDMGPANDQTPTANAKSEKKLKGCVESQNGQYVLMTKKGNVSLTGQDVSAHVGHEVALKGTWDNGESNSNASPTASSSGSEAWSKGTFHVTDVKMESEQCKMKSKDHSGSMSGNSTGSPTSGTTTPPQ